MKKLFLAALIVSLAVGLLPTQALAHHHHRRQGVYMHIKGHHSHRQPPRPHNSPTAAGDWQAGCWINQEKAVKTMHWPFENVELDGITQRMRTCINTRGNIVESGSWCSSTYWTKSWSHWAWDGWNEQVVHIYNQRMYCRATGTFVWTLPWPIPWDFHCTYYAMMAWTRNNTIVGDHHAVSCLGPDS